MVIPVFSGYREEGTRELRLTVNYAPVLAEHANAETPIEDFRVVVPLKEVLSVRIFDLEAFAQFAAMRNGHVSMNGLPVAD